MRIAFDASFSQQYFILLYNIPSSNQTVETEMLDQRKKCISNELVTTFQSHLNKLIVI